MKKMILAAVFCAGSFAFAKPTPILDTMSMTCAQGRAAVQRNGFQHFSVNGSAYRTFYAKGVGSQCPFDYILDQAWVPTLDAAHCPIGFECVPRNW